MRQELSGVEFSSDYAGFYAGFPDTTLISHDDRQNTMVETALSKANALQEAIVSDWIRDKQAKKH
jgi:hypothetical protein